MRSTQATRQFLLSRRCWCYHQQFRREAGNPQKCDKVKSKKSKFKRQNSPDICKLSGRRMRSTQATRQFLTLPRRCWCYHQQFRREAGNPQKCDKVKSKKSKFKRQNSPDICKLSGRRIRSTQAMRQFLLSRRCWCYHQQFRREAGNQQTCDKVKSKKSKFKRQNSPDICKLSGRRIRSTQAMRQFLLSRRCWCYHQQFRREAGNPQKCDKIKSKKSKFKR